MIEPIATVQPKPVPTGGANSYASSDLEALLVLRRYRDWILDEFRPYLQGNAAEIGAGIGSYSEEILQSVATLDLVEPSSIGVERLTAAFARNGRIKLIPSTAEQWLADSRPESYDSVVMINVLEHIADDESTLAGLRRVLRPDGHLLLFVPALMLLFSRLDTLLGHYRRYHLPALRKKVEAAGFVIRSARYFDVLGTAPWLVVNRMFGATEFSPGAAAFYDAVGVPLTRTLERVVTPPFGKNVLLIAQRNHS